jgi:competence protein ComEA
MMQRYAVIAAALGLTGFALWHPALSPVSSVTQGGAPIPSAGPPLGGEETTRRPYRRSAQLFASDGELVVYVAGAVKRPGLYHLRPGERNEKAVALAGGLLASADAGAVNLARRAADGDEIYVPAVGEERYPRSLGRSRRSHSSRLPSNGSVDVNRSDAAELATVPGIGRAIAQRIVELREREGSFASLDELLDVAGMTQTRLERARPYLRPP